jgi:putative transposase
VAAFIVSQREAHGVPYAVSCRALGVWQSWSCKWRPGVLPPSARRRERLDAEVAARFAGRRGKDGAPRITAALRDAGWRVSEKTVAASMRRQGLFARPGRRGRRGTTRRGKARWRAEDLVGRKFPASGINRRWYGDGTEIKTGEGKLYLDSVLDMASRRILGHALGEHHDAALATAALLMAAAVRGGQVAGVIFHTDQGSEYTAAECRAACVRLGIRQSMGRPGSAPATAGSGSWHSTLEWELRSRETFATRSEARAAVAAWIEDYNTVRRHSALGMKSPVAWEQALEEGNAP